MPRLHLLTLDGPPSKHPVRSRTLIGREAENHIRLEDPAVSGHHALLLVRPDGSALIRDLHSSNGTWVDGERVAQCHLAEGCVIRLGDTRFRLEGRSVDLGLPRHASWEWDAEQDEEQPTAELGRERAAPDAEGLSRDLMALYELGDLLHACRSEDQLFRSVARLVERNTGADRVALVECPGPEQAPELLHVWPDGSELNEGRPFSRTVTERVIDQGRTILVPDVAIFGELRQSQSLLGCMARTVLCAPLRSQGRIFGIIFASHHDPGFSFAPRQVRLVSAVGMEAGIALENLRLLRQRERSFFHTTEALVNALDARDDYTAGHSRNVARMALAIARCAQLDAEQQRDLRLGAMLHDIGKIGVDDDCLRSPRALSPEEYRRIQQHTVQGDRILRPLGELDRVREIVRHHHERWDGAGYPDGLRGEAIPLAARVVAIADTIDAITSDRPYRKAAPLEVALQEVSRCKGSQFDPRMVSALFLSLQLGTFPSARLMPNRCA